MTQAIGPSRSTQLYRTLVHEIGHYEDYLDSVWRPRGRMEELDPESVAGDEWLALGTRYWAKQANEKEAFAHRFAREVVARLRSQGWAAFNRLDDPQRLSEQGLDPAWFEAER